MNVALLRSINLGSHKKVAMDDLREVFSELGFSDLRSFLQTGNVIFRSQSRTTANLERLLETEVDQRLALQTASSSVPATSGSRSYRRVRALPSARTASIPAAALTAFAREEDRRQALAAGFQLHVAKPVDAGSLVSAVATLLGRMHAL